VIEVASVAVPLVPTDPVPSEVVPLKNVTVPVAPVGTEAVNVKLVAVPADAVEEVSTVVVVAFVTVRATPTLALGA
jgi:hypothetical protein